MTQTANRPVKPRYNQKYFMSEQQRLILLERYDGKTEIIDELMKYFPGVPRKKVKAWARNLGLTGNREWTEKETKYLESHMHRTSLEDMSHHLGRSIASIESKAKRLGISKTHEGYTVASLALGLGCHHRTVEKWIEKGWLKGKRRKSKHPNDIWYFSDNAIRDFIRRHPEQVNPCKFDWLWVCDLLAGGTCGLGSLDEDRA